MEELAGPVTNRARLADDLLGAALVKHARQVARLTEKRRKLRRALKVTEHELRTARKFLRGLATDRAATAEPTVAGDGFELGHICHGGHGCAGPDCACPCHFTRPVDELLPGEASS